MDRSFLPISTLSLLDYMCRSDHPFTLNKGTHRMPNSRLLSYDRYGTQNI